MPSIHVYSVYYIYQYLSSSFHPQRFYFQPQNITNYLMVGLHPDACVLLQPYHINCYTYMDLTGSKEASNFDSTAFLAKMNARTDVIIEVLEASFSLFLTDVDMICFKNPFDYIGKNNCITLTPIGVRGCHPSNQLGQEAAAKNCFENVKRSDGCF